MLCYASPGDDIIARQPRLGRPACPSFHHAFQKKPVVGHLYEPPCRCVFVCGRIMKSAAHDNGPLRCTSRGSSLVTWDGRGHFTRPGIFYSGRPCL